MKITPVGSPHQIPVSGTPESVRTAKAVAAFNKGQSSYDKPAAAKPQAQEHPVQDANNVSVEELGAIQATSNTEEIVDSTSNIEAATEEGTTTTEETVEEVTPEAPKVDPTLSRQFAQLARQEKALRAKAQQQAQEFKAREEALKAREAALTTPVKQDLTNYISKDKFKSDPLGVLAEAGLSYDEITQQLLTQQPRDPRTEAHIARLEAKLAALEEANTTSQKTYAEQQQAQYQAAVKQIQMDAKKLVSTDPNFETIKATGSVKDVVELITQTYDKDGVLLSVEEAAQQVEDYLVEEAMKITQIDKIKKRMAASNASKPKSEVKTPATPGQTQPMKTLTNATSSQRQLSAKERAILAFKGQLKT